MVPALRRPRCALALLLATGLLASAIGLTAVGASGIVAASAGPTDTFAGPTDTSAGPTDTSAGPTDTFAGLTGTIATFPGVPDGAPATSNPPVGVAASEAPPDPPDDLPGWENGYWYNESIDVTQADGLNETERSRFLARTMARVERLRGLEFEANVSLRFVSRERFRTGFRNGTLPPAVDSEQLQDSFTVSEGFWEAVFFHGEETSARTAIRRFGSEAILAYSAEEGFENEIIVVTASEAAPAVSESVLAHELLHALQGQHFDLDAPRYRPETHDGRLAKDGLVEGAAAYADHLYEQRCEATWDCLSAPGNWAGSRAPEGLAYPYVVLHPYADGATLVHDLVRDRGWSAVTERHRALPNSTEQVIHRNRDPVRSIDVPDRSTGDWSLRTRERVGEATIYLMFWRAASLQDPDPVPPTELRESRAPYDGFDYTSVPSSGWGADRLLLYRNGEQRGYVWHTVWDTPTDAREFETAYRTVLAAYGAELNGNRTWVIPEERAFGDAFFLQRNDTAVRVVNAPTVGTLEELARIEGGGPATGDASTRRSTSTDRMPTDNSNPEPSESPVTSQSTATDGQGAGFGLGATLVAGALALFLLRLRR
ncbi:MAG: Hvo_1808 family surface protein [Haloarculaceae archaeon]